MQHIRARPDKETAPAIAGAGSEQRSKPGSPANVTAAEPRWATATAWAEVPPTGAFVGAAWASLMLGAGGFVVGRWNADTLQRSEKGFYFAVLLLGLYAAVSLQKAVRDRLEGIPVTGIYFDLSWAAVGSALVMLTVGLWNAGLNLSEKGFYAMAFALGLFAAVAVQKNIRDRAMFREVYPIRQFTTTQTGRLRLRATSWPTRYGWSPLGGLDRRTAGRSEITVMFQRVSAGLARGSALATCCRSPQICEGVTMPRRPCSVASRGPGLLRVGAP